MAKRRKGFESDAQRKAVMAILNKLRRQTGAQRGDLTLFHATPRSTRHYIRRSGLQPGVRGMADKVFLSPLSHIDDAQRWASIKGRDIGDRYVGDRLDTRDSRVDVDLYAVTPRGTQGLREGTRAWVREEQDWGEATSAEQRFRTLLRHRPMREFVYPGEIPGHRVALVGELDRIVLERAAFALRKRRRKRRG